jgi:hypothetical protein
MPAFIEEANKLYQTDPAGAVALLYEGTQELKRKMPAERPKGPTGFKNERERQLFLLESGHQSMDWLFEDAQEGIFPEPWVWEVDIGVAQDIVRITREYGN